MFDYTYGIRTVADYLARAKAEVARLDALQEDALPEDRVHEVASAATQAGNTLWHFSDFVYGAPDPEAAHVRSHVGGRDLKEFQERVRASCPSIELCWELSNGGKHFHKKRSAQIDEASVSCVAAVSIAVPWTLKRELKKRRAKLIFPNGRRLRAATVFNDAIAEWERLLT